MAIKIFVIIAALMTLSLTNIGCSEQDKDEQILNETLKELPPVKDEYVGQKVQEVITDETLVDEDS